MESHETTLRAFIEELTRLAAGLERGHAIAARMEEVPNPVPKQRQVRLIVSASLQYQRELSRLLQDMLVRCPEEPQVPEEGIGRLASR